MNKKVIAGVVIEKENKYLLVQQKNPKIYGLWNLPAGKVDLNESVEQAAIRETKEETGFTVELGDKIAFFEGNENTPEKHIFKANITGGEIEFPVEEIITVEWFTYKEIISMKSSLREGYIIETLKKIQ